MSQRNLAYMQDAACLPGRRAVADPDTVANLIWHTIVTREPSGKAAFGNSRPDRASLDCYRLAATLLKVVLRLRARLAELMATNEPIAISAAISPYSIAVAPRSFLISLVSKITDGLSAGFDRGQPPIKTLIDR